MKAEFLPPAAPAVQSVNGGHKRAAVTHG